MYNHEPEDENDDLKDPKEMPIYQKGREIFELAASIADLVDDEDPMQGHVKGFLLEDAALLSVKVAGAEAGDIYDLRMENAAIIRKAARDLSTHCTSLERFGFKEKHYLHLIREAIEEYRVLFVDWVKSFDPWNYVFDSWGLFNPPGVEEDPED